MSEGKNVIVHAEDGMEDVRCPVCGEDYDTEEWPVKSSASDAWGGSGTSSCPNDGCEGTVTVLF